MRRLWNKPGHLTIPRLVAALLAGLTLAGCSSTPTVLNEEELFKFLVEAKRRGPYQFQLQVWPALEKKTVRYCGALNEVRVVGSNSVLLIRVDKEYAGEKLPWSLEGKSDSPHLGQTHKAGEAVCMTGVIESFMERDGVYWGYISVSSVEKPAISAAPANAEIQAG